VKSVVSPQTCEEIATIRRKFQRIGKQHLIVLDETNKRVGEVDEYTIVLPGESKILETVDTGQYAERYDMIAACTMKQTFSPKVFAPAERGKGITTDLLVEYIRDYLAQACGALDVYPLYLLVDRSTIHNEDKIKETFHDWGCQELVEVVKMPAASAKRLSPLDNSLFSQWKQRVLDRGPLTKQNIKQIMADVFNKFTETDIHPQFHHCGLMRGQDPYFDCPDPASHRHGSSSN
jgi:hypothetical protein